MRIIMKPDKNTRILMLILLVSLCCAGASWAEQQQGLVDKNKIKPSWYKNGDYGAVYYGGDGHIITTVCDTKYGNLIYTIKFQEHTDVKVIQGGCPTDSKDYKNIKDE
jgi:hypothetical protein